MLKALALLVITVLPAMAQLPKPGSVTGGGTGAPNATFVWTGSSATGDIMHAFSADAAAKAVIACYDPTGVLLTGWTRSDPNATTIRITFGGAQAADTVCNANATGTGSQGIQGIQGDTGTAGANGNTLLNGSGTPDNGDGANGDYYLDNAATCLYGPKAAGAWPGTCVNIGAGGVQEGDFTAQDPLVIANNLGTCRVITLIQTASGGQQFVASPADIACDDDDKEVHVDFASATTGHYTLIKGGGGAAGVGGGGLNNVVEDTTPQLGGNLDLNSFVITGLVIGTNVQAWDADLDTIAGLAKTDDALPVGNGTIWQMKTLPDCDDSGGNHLNYDTATNAFSCGTSGGSGSFPAATAYQVYRRNSDDTADEAATVTAGTGVTVTPSSGQITISSDCAQVACLAQNNAYLGNNAYAGTTVQAPSATQTLVAGDAITVSTVTFKSISAASGITLTSTPTIADGTAGQELILVNDGSNNITLQDEANLAGSNLCLPADTNITLAPKEALRGVMSVTSACWIFFR